MTEKALRYLTGFGNEHTSEALKGALPAGQNAPQSPPRGLYTEQISGTPFTAPRGHNRRSWLYRIRPSAMHKAFRRIDNGLLGSTPFDEAVPSPNRLRWNPLPFPDEPADFVDGLVTTAGNGDTSGRAGVAIHIYRATRSMERRLFYDADGELLIVPQLGRLLLATELGVMEAGPGQIAVVPRGVKFRVELRDDRTTVSMRCATTSGCSTMLLFGSITPGIRISLSGLTIRTSNALTNTSGTTLTVTNTVGNSGSLTLGGNLTIRRRGHQQFRRHLGDSIKRRTIAPRINSVRPA